MNRVVLVINNSSWFGKRAFRTWLPAVPIITALIKDLCDFSVLDANVNGWDFGQTLGALRQTDADVVLISALSVDYQIQYHKLAEIAKAALPGCTTLMGGVYPSSLPHWVLEDRNVDYVMQGHAEDRLPDILRAILSGDDAFLAVRPGLGMTWQGKRIFTPLKTFQYQAKTIVKPDYSLLDIEKYFELQSQYSAKNYSTECAEKRSVNIIASYGCPYNCFFCANRSLSGSHVVYRPVDDVLDEIDYFVREHQVKQVSFMDDNIVSDKVRATDLFSKILERKYDLEIQIGNLAAWDLDDNLLRLLRDAGCSRIGISVESGSQRVLREIMHKPLDLSIIPPIIQKCKMLGIMVVADFIIGLPGETWDEIRSSFSFADAMGADLCNINIAVPYPGTDLYAYMVEHAMLPDDFAFDERFFITGLVKTDEFTPAELKILAAFEWERINASTPEKRARAQKVLRLTDDEFAEYCYQMRQGAVRFVKNYG